MDSFLKWFKGRSLWRSISTDTNRPIRLKNTLSGRKEVFVPLSLGRVSMYNCGPTVYRPVHIGNLRSYVFADLLRRLFEYNGYKVHQVINLTDVGHLTSDDDLGEDKVEKSARESGQKIEDIVRHVTSIFMNDLEKLNINAFGADFPRASHHIEEQIALIETLEEKGYTYKISDGVYFDTSKFAGYGKLGGINLVGLKEGARVEANPEKKNPTDFALWKFSPGSDEGGLKRQMEWSSPWGVGFPGWHIECSAMAMHYLGETFDVHTGGIDHIPVHHNDEIAQSEAATGKPFAHYWLHSAFINIDGAKISKSLGNDFPLSALLAKDLNPLAYRYWLLSAHYSSPVNFTWEALSGAQRALDRLYEAFADLGPKAGEVSEEYEKRFSLLVNDDLDTPKALALLWELVKDDSVARVNKKATILQFDKILGLDLVGGEEELEKKKENVPEMVLKMSEEREKARVSGEWALADELRDKIEMTGYAVRDTERGPEISRK